MFELVLITLYYIKVVISYYEHIIYIISLDTYCYNFSANILLSALAILLLLICLLTMVFSVFLLPLLFELPINIIWFDMACLLVELVGAYLLPSTLIW